MSSIENINTTTTRDDRFLAEEVLLPWVNCVDASRILMASSQIPQTVVPIEGEVPRVFTGYEGQVGSHSSSYLRSDRNWRVHAVIRKNDFNQTFILVDENNQVHVVHRSPCEGLSEGFGYTYDNSGMDSVSIGEVITEGTIMRRSTAYDEHMNLRFGANLRAVYLPWEGKTYEDAIVISESAAAKLDTWGVATVEVSVNTNDLLLNLYGTEEVYKVFPDIGEEIKNQVLCGRRRIHHESMLHDMTLKRLMSINHDSDDKFFGNGQDGIIVDVDVFSNESIETLEKHSHYNGQVIEVLKTNLEYHAEVIAALDPWISKGEGSYTDEAAFTWKRSSDIYRTQTSNDSQGTVRWKSASGSNFDNYFLRFKILTRIPVSLGSKITNRFGGKGVISEILPDHDMPTTEHGVHAEVILSPLGVFNRENPAQLFEQEINMISDQIVAHLEAQDISIADKLWQLAGFLGKFNPSYAEAYTNHIVSLSAKAAKNEWNAILEEGVYVHIPPFFDNPTIDDFARLYRELPGVGPYMFCGIEVPLVMGDVYYMRLKHEPRGKFSARSSSNLNLKGVPSKSTRFKQNQQLHSKTPIRFGEMETFNLMVSKDLSEVLRLTSQYSSNENDREKLIEALATRDIMDLESVELTGTPSNVRQVHSVLWQSMGINLTDNSQHDTQEGEELADAD
jgi:DNA-directed RNA polymerase beta subunit